MKRSKWDQQVAKNSQGHISQVSDSRKNEIAESIFGLSYWCLIGLGWYWMLSDEGRLGVCKITSSVVSPLALSLPLLDSSALPQTWPRTFYSLFPLSPYSTFALIAHPAQFSFLTKSVPLFPFYIANDAWIEEFSSLWIFFAYLFTISVPYHYSYADYQNCCDLQRAGWQLGLIMMIILSKYDHDIEDRLAWLWWSANDNWLALGAALPTAPDQPYNQVHPLQNTILSTFKKYSTTLWDIFALNFVPLFLLLIIFRCKLIGGVSNRLYSWSSS